ncbi:MAG TPA: hypothetical protein VHO25_03920, partial [Polyangiaceae bacterium]|nr:hypothetical protein [Polyangiaceae bacterium]
MKTNNSSDRVAAQRALRTLPIGSFGFSTRGVNDRESKSGPRLVSPIYLSSTELARRLLKAALAHRLSNDTQDLVRLACLARDAASHVQRIGRGTVDYI